MSSKIKVRLISGTSPFHRSVRDDAGAVVETMVFPPGVEVEVDGAKIPAILDALRYGDNGGVLAEVNDKGKPVETPSKAVEDAKKAADAKAKAALAAKPAPVPAMTKAETRTMGQRMSALEAGMKQLHDVVSELEAKSAEPKHAKKGG